MIQCATPTGTAAINAGIAAYRSARTNLTQAVTAPDIAPHILRANERSHSIVYEWGIGTETFRGHVHYRGFQGMRQAGPVAGNVWIEGVNGFDFPFPAYVLNAALTQAAAHQIYGI